MCPLVRPLALGALRLPNRVFLAPLAGVSDPPFRRVCREQGAGLGYVEMLSATALRYRSSRTFRMMARDADEPVLGVQVTGPSAGELAEGVGLLDERSFDTIDLNMGCPVRKVVKAGCGSAALVDPDRVSEIVEAARRATAKPLSVKIRIGFTRETVNVGEVAARIASAGADMLTIHGRTREDDYATRADYDAIRLGVESARARQSIVTVANGDVLGAASAARALAVTGADAVMVSRGALGNPWVFREILTGEPVAPRIEEWIEVVLGHLEHHGRHYEGHPKAAAMFRKHLVWYAKGFPGARRLRERVNGIESLEEARELMTGFAESLPPRTQRYRGGSADPEWNPKSAMDRTLDRGVGSDGLPPPGPSTEPRTALWS